MLATLNGSDTQEFSCSSPEPHMTQEQFASLDSLRRHLEFTASIDDDFRKALSDDPRATISSLLSSNESNLQRLPDSLEIVLLEKVHNQLIVIVPSADKATSATGEIGAFARSIHSTPELLGALHMYPRQVLISFLEKQRNEPVSLPESMSVKIVLESPTEFCLALNPIAASTASYIGDDELRSIPDIFNHSPGATCTCTSDGCTSNTCNTMNSTRC
jgi:hypothetical protein